MDFHLDEDLLTIQGLAREIFTDKAEDAALWDHLARAGLVGLALPEQAGGAGLGLDALCVVLEEQGRCVAPVPLWSSGVAALAVAAAGTHDHLLPGAADGSLRLALALEEYDGRAPSEPACTAVRTGDDWRLTGTKAAVPSPAGASHVLVSATGPVGPALFLLPTSGDGIAWEQTETTTRDLAGNLTLDEARAELLGGTDALASLLRMAAVALAAVQVGVAEGALRLAATYLSTREQFGRPLATFQSTQHQLADCLIDIDAMRVTLWQALATLEARDVLVAKWWCDQAGLDVVHRVQHVHGGIGVDVDYPVHRYFLWGKQISSTLGGSAAALADLGEELAS